jgi:hypothetical protein
MRYHPSRLPGRSRLRVEDVGTGAQVEPRRSGLGFDRPLAEVGDSPVVSPAAITFLRPPVSGGALPGHDGLGSPADEIFPVPQPTDEPELPQPGGGPRERPDQTLRIMDYGLPHPTVATFGGDHHPLSSTGNLVATPVGLQVDSIWLPNDEATEDDTMADVHWPAMNRELVRWCNATAVAFGRSSVPIYDVLALLVHRLLIDARFSHTIRVELATKYRLVRAYTPDESVR